MNVQSISWIWYDACIVFDPFFMHETHNFSHLVGALSGFNADLIEEHIKLYEGYVKKYNEINDALKTVEPSGNYSYAPHSELLRRRSVAWNGTKLHELYFEALTPGGTVAPASLQARLEASFGSVDAWMADARAAASATPGWVLLVENKDDEALQHYVVYEHQNHVPAEVRVLLALDCWEHAFAKQYGTNKAAYLDAFFANVDLEKVASRLSS